jgi:hypothetical protein
MAWRPPSIMESRTGRVGWSAGRVSRTAPAWTVVGHHVVQLPGDADPFGPHRPVGLPSLLPLGLFGPVPVAVDQGPVRADVEEDGGDGHDQDQIPDHPAPLVAVQLGHREHHPRGGGGHQSPPDVGPGSHHVQGDDHRHPAGDGQRARADQDVDGAGQSQSHHQHGDGMPSPQHQDGQGGQAEHGGHGQVERRSVIEESGPDGAHSRHEHHQHPERLEGHGRPRRRRPELGRGHAPAMALRRPGA